MGTQKSATSILVKIAWFILWFFVWLVHLGFVFWMGFIFVEYFGDYGFVLALFAGLLVLGGLVGQAVYRRKQNNEGKPINWGAVILMLPLVPVIPSIIISSGITLIVYLPLLGIVISGGLIGFVIYKWLRENANRPINNS